MRNPKVSIIIPVLNKKESLQNAIESVLNQDFADFELIIIDGNSNDGTLDIIEKFREKISWFKSSEDKNVYDAMNKGVAKTNGDWIYFLGADDILKMSTLKKIFFQNLEGVNLIYGNIIYKNNKVFKGEYSNTLFVKNSIHHQGVFYHKRCFYARNFNANYPVLSDYDFNLELFLKKKKALYFNFDFAICGPYGISKQKGWQHYKEEFLIKKEQLNAVQFLVYGSITLLKYFLNQMGLL
tara:strand:+ start:1161 stop:1877 length:717 start_codon:yes stop_codon:yes gene_type:complete